MKAMATVHRIGTTQDLLCRHLRELVEYAEQGRLKSFVGTGVFIDEDGETCIMQTKTGDLRNGFYEVIGSLHCLTDQLSSNEDR